MENDQRIENFEHLHNMKRGSPKEIVTLINRNNKEDINMDPMNNKIVNSQTTQVSLAGGAKGVSNSNSPKMGSRRIFTPQFKLQVLESYRNDHDCKGNQRATARKYNIHRRQIQKWLQCESSLRSSVANINQNSVKHQFHNVNMQQQQTKNVISNQSAVNGLSYTPSQMHSSHICLDSSKGSTTHTTLDVPSVSCVSATSTQETQDILDANLAAAVAAAAGTIARTNNSGVSSAAGAAIVSPLRPSAIISANRNTNPTIPSLVHHQHHYGLPTYSNMSSTATVPILVHHLTNSQQTPYQYHHNISYTTPTLSHHQTEKQHTTSYFTPTLVLPTTAATSNSYTGGNNEHMDKLDLLPPMGNKTYPKILTEKTFLYNNNQFHLNYECTEAPRITNSANTLEAFTVNQFNGDAISTYATAYPFGPMDLSLRHNRETKTEFVASTKTSFHMDEIPIKKERNDTAAIDVVDLTYRKRSNNYKTECPQKQQKLSNTDDVLNKLVAYNTNEAPTNSSNSTEDDDIEIEVGTEEKFLPSSKPVKLFKPYLLGECENKDNLNGNVTNKLGKNGKIEELEQTAKKDDTSTSKDTFPDTVNENVNTCIDSTNFLLESRSESPRSACSPVMYIPTMSPTNFQYSKGSPASSGYESSTSTYSDTSLSSRNDPYPYGQTYSVNLQMQTIYHENIHFTHPSKQVQRWLEKEDSNSLETTPTIALFA